MIHVELTIQRRHLIILAGVLLAAVMLIPGIAWASHSFTDVPTSDWAHADIAWLKDTGLTNGCGDGTTFCPEDSVKRKELAAFMHRLSGGDDRTIDGRLDALEAENTALKDLLAGVTRNGDTLLFDGMNLQIVNGTGSTGGAPNGLGNVVVGYNEDVDSDAVRTGSHYLIIGDEHTYSSFGGAVVGYQNTASGGYASVSGGLFGTASGDFSSVSGGHTNTASGNFSSVTGGSANTASGQSSSLSGGRSGTASGQDSSVSGGSSNTASGSYSSVSGGELNTSSGDRSSVSGGDRNNTTGGIFASVSGGTSNTASGQNSSVTGGSGNTAVGINSTIAGGDGVVCSSTQAAVCGEGSLTAVD